MGRGGKKEVNMLIVAIVFCGIAALATFGCLCVLIWMIVRYCLSALLPMKNNSSTNVIKLVIEKADVDGKNGGD